VRSFDMPVRMYDEMVGIDRRVYGFVYNGGANGGVLAVCYDENGNGYTVPAENLRPVE
jgi:hypothetical protein